MPPLSPEARALCSLDGLSLGDAFGERFFGSAESVLPRIRRRELPEVEWRYTDDTEMALSIVRVLLDHQAVEQDALARLFAQRMQPDRGYGVGAYKVLSGIRMGGDWRALSRSGFGGVGSFGNGAAMRVAPLGAFFADRPLTVIAEQARLSAEITHAHPEGIAGAVAIAVAAALACRAASSSAPLGQAFLEDVRDATPPGYTKDGIDEALAFGDASPVEAARALGNGAAVTAADTVPFCLWVCARFSHDFVESMWSTVTALGDRDTTCAIVGGIVACQTERAGIPDEWFEYREPIEP
jgi:ADP-ribosylglycohydrolase